MNRTAVGWVVAWLWLSAPIAAEAGPPAAEEIEFRLDGLLARMTLEEKIGQLQQSSGDGKTGQISDDDRPAIREGRVGSMFNVRGAGNANGAQRVAVEESRLKIPLLLGYDVIHGYRTIFPIPLGEASSFDPATAEQSARVAAGEASASGVRWTFAPMVDIARDSRWGRITEGSGEDPFLGSAMARARVRGFQGTDISAPDRVIATAKHWVAYGAAQGGREYNTVDLSERTLRSVYFPPFKAALDEGVATFMSALNEVNGVPCTASHHLLTDVLRDEWKFEGVIVADYQAVEQLVDHGIAVDDADAARQAVEAGIDMEEQSRAIGLHGVELVRSGRLAESTVDRAVRRILQLKARAGLFERPYVDESREKAALLTEENRRAARESAARSLVLLKNDVDILPIRPDVGSIALIGPLADSPQDMLGAWFGDGRGADAVSLLAGLRSRLAEKGSKAKVEHAKGCDVEKGTDEEIAEAVRIAKRSDVAILAVGESSSMSGEATSRTSLGLPGRQDELIRAVLATGKPTAVVLFNGRPLALGPIADEAPAILEAWFGGTEAGLAVADALLGDVNPGGKLPATFPRNVGQVPIYYAQKRTGRPASVDDKYTSKYADIPIGPRFPFGHGLSYTKFRFSNLKVEPATIPVDGRVEVSVEVANVGDRPGDEVPQLYLTDVVASVTRPVKELRGFERITLRPGESRTVRFALGRADLGFLDRALKFVVEPGEFRVTVGPSSAEGLVAGFRVEGPK